MFARTPAGVVAVCASNGGRTDGFVVNTFVGISLEPPLVGFFVQEDSTTWPILVDAPALGLSLLGDAHGDSVGQMAAKGVDRFTGIRTETLPSGAIILRESPASMETTVFSEIPVGDHRLVVLRVHEVFPAVDGDPLIYLRSAVRHLRPHAHSRRLSARTNRGGTDRC